MPGKQLLLIVAAAMGIPVAVAGCSQSVGGADGPGTGDKRLILTGSSTVAPLAAEIGKEFESRHPGVRVDVQTGGSSRGIADARNGLADIGMVSRNLNPDENDLIAHAIASDGICLIVHQRNPVSELTREQVVAIYTGQIDNWQQVGGSDAPITVVNKAQGRSTLELFLHHFDLESTEVAADVVIGDNEQGVKTVSGNPGSIGYVSIGTAQHDADHGAPVKLLPVGGVEASSLNVRNGTFPLSRTLNFVTSSEPTGVARELIDFAQSPEVQKLVEDLYFVPLEN